MVLFGNLLCCLIKGGKLNLKRHSFSGVATGGSRGAECHPWMQKRCQLVVLFGNLLCCLIKGGKLNLKRYSFSGVATGGSRGAECHPWMQKRCQLVVLFGNLLCCLIKGGKLNLKRHSFSGVATGGSRGQSATPECKKGAKNREKEGKIRKKRQKSGRFFHFASPDRAGYATALINNANNWQICLRCNSAVHNILLTRFSEHPQTRVPPEDIIQEFTLGQVFSKGGVQKHTGLWCSLCGPQTSIFDMFWPFMAWTMIENPWLRPYFSHRFLYQNLKLGPAGKYFLMPSSQTDLLRVTNHTAVTHEKRNSRSVNCVIDILNET